MAVPDQTTGDEDAIGSLFKGGEQVFGVNFAGTGNAHDFHRRRIREPLAPGGVGGGIGTVVAAESHNDGFKLFHYAFTLAKS
jgi:hypothetical protein